ncbi:MAG: hypothetical protein IJV92_05750 [Phascolarctobacterium sp.]|nr:hypothetical protein [Phascolarctobacterium sp.]
MNSLKAFFSFLIVFTLCALPTNIFAKEVIITDGSVARFDITNNVPSSPYFTQNDYYNMESNEHLTILHNFTTYQQTTMHTCGPVVANMVVDHFLGKPLHSELEAAKMMGCNKYNGTTTKGLRGYFRDLGWNATSSADTNSPKTYTDFLNFVQGHLQANTPIMVENVEWGGHWRIIIGYDTMNTANTGDDVLIFADPYDKADHLQNGYSIVPAEKFFYMWFDAIRFAKGANWKQWVVAKPNK